MKGFRLAWERGPRRQIGRTILEKTATFDGKSFTGLVRPPCMRAWLQPDAASGLLGVKDPRFSRPKAGIDTGWESASERGCGSQQETGPKRARLLRRASHRLRRRHGTGSDSRQGGRSKNGEAIRNGDSVLNRDSVQSRGAGQKTGSSSKCALFLSKRLPFRSATPTAFLCS